MSFWIDRIRLLDSSESKIMPSLVPVSGHESLKTWWQGNHKHVVVFQKLYICSHIGNLSILGSVLPCDVVGGVAWKPQVTDLLDVDHHEAIHFGILLLWKRHVGG
ncbi:hypothetical protein N8I77_000470 [Diaporthe amygdali]|uniref:Uncharacterized protein n=1 Tax=Phomopsis amygdali TaxID=1214568 RepID=A0AAD9W8D0_PHOAM|nr:hypothetical protein N8I77_000470 [Diaporthe amygdali]